MAYGSLIRSAPRVLPGSQQAEDAARRSQGRELYNPDDPYSFLRTERASTYPGVAARQIGEGGSQGYLGVNDPRLRAMVRNRILQAGSARKRRAGLAGMLYGLDPYEQRNALMNADIESSGQQFGDLNAADLGLAMHDQDWIRQLFGKSLDYDLGQRRMGDEEARDARFQAREHQGGGLGGYLGQAAGALTGGFLGGYGQERGQRAGRGRRTPSGGDAYGGGPY